MFTLGQYKEGPLVFSVTEDLSMGPNKRAVKLQPQVCVQHLSSHKEKKIETRTKSSMHFIQYTRENKPWLCKPIGFPC